MPITIRSCADMARVLATPIDAQLKALLVLRRDQLLRDTDLDIGEFAYFYIFDDDATIARVEAVLGVPLLVDGEPWFEHAVRHGSGLTELTFILTDDGLAHVAIIEESKADADLTALLRQHG